MKNSINNSILIGLIKIYPVIYNNTNDSESVAWKKRAFENISCKLKVGVPLIEKRWNSIMTAFTQRWIEKMNGNNTSNVHSAYQRYDEELEFLLPYMEHTKMKPKSKSKNSTETNNPEPKSSESDAGESEALKERNYIGKQLQKILGEEEEENEYPGVVDEVTLLSSEEDQETYFPSARPGKDKSIMQTTDDLKTEYGDQNTDDLKSKLIDLVRQYPAVYDVSMTAHRDRTITDNVWRKIGIELDAEPSLCRETWKTMKEDYFNSLKPLGTGSARESKKAIDKRLDFLNVAKVQRQSKTNLKPSNVSSVSKIPIIEIIPDDNLLKQPSKNVKKRKTKTDILIEQMAQDRKKFFTDAKDICFNDDNEKDERVVERQKNREKQDPDDTDVFFQTMASSAKSLPKPMLSELKMKVLKAMNEMEARVLKPLPWNFQGSGFEGTWVGPPAGPWSRPVAGTWVGPPVGPWEQTPTGPWIPNCDFRHLQGENNPVGPPTGPWGPPPAGPWGPPPAGPWIPNGNERNQPEKNVFPEESSGRLPGGSYTRSYDTPFRSDENGPSDKDDQFSDFNFPYDY